MIRGFLAIIAGALILVALGGCEYLEGEPEPTIDPNDPAAPRIGGTITEAMSKFNVYGADYIYDLLSPEVRLVCSKEEFAADMADMPHLGQLRMMQEIEYTDEGRARVTLVAITNDGDAEQEWLMALGQNNVWQIMNMPGMSDCRIAA